MKTKNKTKTMVLGAGPAGLTAGYFLAANNFNVEVFEKQNRVGGLSKTIARNGFSFDLGTHRWFTKVNELNQLVGTLLDEELIEVQRKTRIFFDGTYFNYPIKIPNVLKGLGPLKGAKVVFSYLLSRARHHVFPRPVKNFEEWTSLRFGHVLYGYFFKAYTEKLWGIPCRQIGAEWAAQRIRGLSLLTAVKTALLPTKNRPKSLIDKFNYPKLGIGRISEKLAQAISKKGGKVRLAAAVGELKHKNNKIISLVVDDRQGGKSVKQTITADRFISSIPITELVQILSPRPPRKVIQAAQKLTYRDLITVHLIINRPRITADTWIYVHDPKAGMGRLHEPKNWSGQMVPNKNQTSLVCEFWCQKGDDIWSKTDQELIEWAIRDLEEIMKFIKKEDVVESFVIRTPKAYPVYKIGYKTPLRIVKNYLKRFKNLQLIGRYGTYKYNNIDHAMLSGLWAAKNIIDGKDAYDLEQINVDQEYHEEKREVL